MKYLKQFGIIIAVSFAGELISKVVPLMIPSSIYGLILLFVLLQTGLIKLEWIKETGKFLVEIMPVMFIPAAVGLLESWGALQGVFIPVIVITIVSTIVVMIVSGRITQRIVRVVKKEEETNGNAD